MQSNDLKTGIKEECGVFGIFDLSDGDVFKEIYYGLLALQHRGQESCGIAIRNTSDPKTMVKCHKGLGLVNDVFDENQLGQLTGNLGIGHVRYSTTGGTTLVNTQPLVLKYSKGTFTLAHNGNLVNTSTLRQQLEKNGDIFQTTIDSEVIAAHIARERLKASTIEQAIRQTAAKIRGSYGLVITSPGKLVGVRDPLGLKPLCLGRKGSAYLIASESCSILAAGGTFIRDIKPGEILTVTKDGIHSDLSLQQNFRAHCIFEYIYFARLDSWIDGVSVYESRLQAGDALARSYPVEADLVAGVPDSGLTAAMGYSKASGIPFEFIFYKNSYSGRSFIQPSKEGRDSTVKVKLSVLEPAVKGKRIVLVDDSIVRGTTIKNLIRMLKQAGATQVHVRIASPPFLYPCYFGVDVPSNRQLIAHNFSTEEIKGKIGADSLSYLPITDLEKIVGGISICHACFTGHYPMDISDLNTNVQALTLQTS